MLISTFDERRARAQRTPTISVVVPATNSPATLERCLVALRAAGGADELIVVDDRRLAGPSAARNAGSAAARGGIVMFVDADVEVGPDAIGAVRRAFAEQPELAAVFGCYDDDPSDRGLVSRFRNLLHHHVHVSAAGRAQTFWAGIGAVRSDWLERAGGFDEARYVVPSIEDIELGTRIRELGGEIALDPRIQGKHLKRWTLSSMVITDLLRRGTPWAELAIERRSAPAALNLGWRHRFAALLALVAAGGALRRRLLPVAAATAALAALHTSFMALLTRRGGTVLAAAGVPLLLVHHACAAISVPLAAARVAVRRRAASR